MNKWWNMSQGEFQSVSCAVVTVSDTRSPNNDHSGDLIAERLKAMGHSLKVREIIPDDIPSIQDILKRCIEDAELAIVLFTGGTGITRRDVTPDAIRPMGTKHIPGFGELFRWLSFQEIGASTIQSRADAWLCEDTLVFALPGSTGAVRLAMDQILVEQLDVRTRPCNFIQLLPRIRG